MIRRLQDLLISDNAVITPQDHQAPRYLNQCRRLRDELFKFGKTNSDAKHRTWAFLCFPPEDGHWQITHLANLEDSHTDGGADVKYPKGVVRRAAGGRLRFHLMSIHAV
jgi:hypothetical protein